MQARGVRFGRATEVGQGALGRLRGLGRRWCRGGLMASALCLGAAVLANTGSTALAAEASSKVPPAAQFFQRPAVIEAQLSPDGHRLAVTTAARTGSRVGVYVFNLKDEPLSVKPVAVFRDEDVRNVSWLGNDHLMFSAVDLQAPSGEDYRVGPGLYLVRHDGSDLRQLIEREGRSMISGAPSRIRSLPFNHLLLHVPSAPASGEGRELIMGQFVVQGGEFREIRPLRFDLESGRTRSFDLAGQPPGAQQWWFSPKGEIRAVLTLEKGRQRLYWHRAAAAEPERRWQLLTEADGVQLPFTPVWVGSGEELLVSEVRGARGERVVARFDFSTGKPAAEPMVSVAGFDFQGRFLSDGDKLLGVRLEADTEQTLWFDPARKALQALADQALPGRVNRISCARCGADDAQMVVRSYSDRHPGELWLYRKGQPKPWQPISAIQPGIDPRQMASVDLHRIRTRDGMDLPVWVTVPPGPAQARPAVVLVHGGPWVRGGHWRWQGMQQFLASRGYVVIEPEFRGSDGYGLTHLRAGFKQWGLAMQDDVADALRWAQGQGLAGSQACIAGASYGGYSTLMGLVRDPDLFRCGVAWVAVTDPLLLVEGSWRVRDDISDSNRRYTLREMVGDPAADKELLLAASPVAQAARLKAPLLLAFGSDDLRVPLEHGERLRDALRKAGRDPEWVVYSGEAHGWRLEKNQIDFAQRLERFLGEHLPVAEGRR